MSRNVVCSCPRAVFVEAISVRESARWSEEKGQVACNTESGLYLAVHFPRSMSSKEQLLDNQVRNINYFIE